MRMTPTVLVIGGLLIFAPVLFMHVILPWLTMSEQGSDIFRPRTGLVPISVFRQLSCAVALRADPNAITSGACS